MLSVTPKSCIWSACEGLLRDDKTALDALLAVLPAGTLSGAPKVRAMQLIDQLENNDADYTEAPSVIWDLTETLTPALPSVPYYLKTKKLMFRQALEL